MPGRRSTDRRGPDGDNLAVIVALMRIGGVMAVLWLVLVFVLAARPAAAAPPEACRMYQRHLTAEAYSVLGPNAPVALLAAQIQQESACRADATSRVGAQGLTQFMPATARDMAARYPRELGPADPLDWRWAISAQVRYMRDIVREPWRTECDTWAAKLSAYNGGEGWVRRDQAVCRARAVQVATCDACIADRWYGHVEDSPDTRRAAHNIRENRGYPRRIMLTLQPRYASWGRLIECPQR